MERNLTGLFLCFQCTTWGRDREGLKFWRSIGSKRLLCDRNLQLMKIKEFPNYCTVTALLRVSLKEEKKLEAELWASLWARERTLILPGLPPVLLHCRYFLSRSSSLIKRKTLQIFKPCSPVFVTLLKASFWNGLLEMLCGNFTVSFHSVARGVLGCVLLQWAVSY